MKPDDVARLLPLVVLVVLAYVLLIRPTRKRARDVAALQRALSSGDQIMLTSGIFGSVVGVDDEIVQVEIAPGVVIRAHRGAVGKIVTDAPTEFTADTDGEGTPAAELHDGHDSDSNRGAI